MASGQTINLLYKSRRAQYIVDQQPDRPDWGLPRAIGAAGATDIPVRRFGNAQFAPLHDGTNERTIRVCRTLWIRKDSLGNGAEAVHDERKSLKDKDSISIKGGFTMAGRKAQKSGTGMMERNAQSSGVKAVGTGAATIRGTGSTTNPSGAAVKLTHEQIAKRAEAIWIQKGRKPGQDEQNWREAEAQLKAELGIS